MSRMAKRYQGVRAGKMINIILKGDENNIQPESTIYRVSDTLNQDTPKSVLSYNDHNQKTKQQCKIIRSYSLSNLSKVYHLQAQRNRCSSLPPTISMPYVKRSHVDIFSDVCLPAKGYSLSVSALTHDDTKDYQLKRCSSAPLLYFSDYEYSQILLESEPGNLIGETCSYDVTITQKYLEPGHTQMECDSVHAAIERKLKNREIHLPSDYIAITKEARVNPFPYEAIQINYDFVKDYNNKKNWRYSTIRPGRKAGEPVVVDLRAIQYRPDGSIHYKINFDDDWTDIPVRPKKINSVTYSPLHNRSIPIASTKFNHLQQLKEVLPRDCHAFYDNLPHE